MKARMPEVWVASRMLAWLLVLQVLKRVMPLPALVALMWVDRRTSRPATPGEIERLSSVARWVAARVWPRRSGTCLEQSLVLYRFLSARCAHPELVIGVRRQDETVGAHAWITIDGRPVGHSTLMLSDFSPAVVFGARGVPSRSNTLVDVH